MACLCQIAALVNIGVEGLSFGWRVSLGLHLILACCLIIGSPLIPESPRWITQQTARLSIIKFMAHAGFELHAVKLIIIVL